MKNSIYINVQYIILLCMLSCYQIGMAQDGSNDSSIISQRLRVYYVENPNTNNESRRVDISNSSSIFGSNPNMQIAQQLVQAIFQENEQQSEFHESITTTVRGFRERVAIFFYDDTDGLTNNEVSNTWVNCIRSNHFFICGTQEHGDDYERIVHLGAHQMNSLGLARTQAQFLRVLRGASGNTGWYDRVPESEASASAFEVCAPFKRNYEEFRQSVVRNSAELRRGMIYRSDSLHAGTVIDRRPDLRHIHRGYMRIGFREGQEVCLSGNIVRDSRRYVLFIRFSTRSEEHTFEDDHVRSEHSEDRQQRIRQRMERIVTRMGPSRLPPRGTGESGRLSHIQFMSQLTGYRRAWERYFQYGSIDQVRSWGYAEFQQPGMERAIREMQSLDNQPQWVKVGVIRQHEYILEQIDNNIERTEQRLLENR